MKTTSTLPIYSLRNFSNSELGSRAFQVEIFDANRHFAVEYPHRHDFFEVLYLHKGSGEHVIDSNRYKVEPPCIFFMSPGQAHKLELSKDIEGYIFIFTSEFYLINQINQNRLLEFPFFFTIRQTNPPLRLTNESDAGFLENLLLRAVTEQNKTDYSEELLRSLLDLLLVYSASIYKADEQMMVKGKGHLLVKRFFQLIEENYQNNHTINQYASLLAITPNHLTQTVKLLTGKTAKEVIQQKQILEIKRLLIHTNLGVSEIAAKLNFIDQSYFTKFFKQATGMTPLRFRNESMKIT